jgi:8-oxo-dGTP diphosphatase
MLEASMTAMDAFDVDGLRHEVELAELSWRPSIYAVLIQNESVLLVPQKERGFDLPGGGVELGESLSEAAVREVKEETGLDIDPGLVVAIREAFFVWAPADPAARMAYQCLMFYVTATVVGGNLSTDGFDSRESQDADMAQWIPLRTLDTVKVASSADFRPIVETVAAGPHCLPEYDSEHCVTVDTDAQVELRADQHGGIAVSGHILTPDAGQ